MLSSMAISSLSLSFMQLSDTFGVSMEVAKISLSIGVVIVGLGAAILAPLSEHFGRVSVYWRQFPRSALALEWFWTAD